MATENTENPALATWRKKLESLRTAEATTADPALKFQLQTQIDECLTNIRELEKEKQPKTPENNALGEFRQRAKEYLSKRYIEPFEKILLESLRKKLGLTPAQAEAIIKEEETPILKAREEYRDTVVSLIEHGYYPFSPQVNAELAKIQARNNLTNQEVEEITRPIFAAREINVSLIEKEFETVRVNSKGIIIARETKKAQTFREDLGNGVKLEMVYIPGGKFLMGTEDAEIERLVKKFNRDWYRDEAPQHEATVPAFWMSKYPITQEQWLVIAGLGKVKIDLEAEPGYFKGEKRPVERVNWSQAIEYCDRVGKLTGRKYKLPSEAQWEYACRGGTKTPFAFGETLTTELANYNGNYTFAEEAKGIYREGTTEVGKFYPNGFGLYDMHGNVWEWCEDDWHDNYEKAPKDGSAWLNDNNSQQLKCLRGGSWNYYPDICRSAYRNRINAADVINDSGFRLASGFPGLSVLSNP